MVPGQGPGSVVCCSTLDDALTEGAFLDEYYLRSEKVANFACLGDEILAFHRNVMSF